MTSKVTVRPHAGNAPADAAASAGLDALPDNVVIDSLGRHLTIEDPDFLTESRIMRVLGDSSSNMGYVLGYVMPAIRVVAVDGVRAPYPANIAQIDAAIQRLGREGTAAVLARDAKKLEEAKAAALNAAQSGQHQSAETTALKNS